MFNPLNLIENSPVALSTDRIPNMNDYKERKHSFFVETLQFLTEMNADFYEAKRCFYVSVLESSSSTNVTVVHESFGDFLIQLRISLINSWHSLSLFLRDSLH